MTSCKSIKIPLLLSAALAIAILLLLALVWRGHWRRMESIELAHAARMASIASQRALWSEILADDPCKARDALDAARFLKEKGISAGGAGRQ